MADAKTLKIVRLLAIAHIVVGILLVIFGIVDRVEGYFWTGEGCFGIWCGVWMVLTGALGIPGSNRERTSSSQAFAGAFMGCAITSAVFGGIIIICYSISIAQYRTDYWWRDNFYQRYWYNYDAEMAITAITLILGVIEFSIGIWASILCCYMNPCQCCVAQSDQGPTMVYMSNQGVVYSTGGVPMGVPMQAPGGVVMVPVSSSGAVGVHPQTVQVPAGSFFPAVGQPQMYQVPSAGVVSAQPQVVQVPTSGGFGGQAHMVQVPISGALGGQAQMVPLLEGHGIQGQMVQAPTSGSEEGQPQFVRVTADGPVTGEK